MYHTLDSRTLSRNQLVSSIKHSLKTIGAVMVEHLPYDGPSDFGILADLVITRPMSYKEGNNSRKDLGEGVLTVGTEPAHLDIMAHNEMSYLDNYPQYIAFGCMSCPEGKGSTNIANNVLITDAIMGTSLDNQLREKGISYMRTFSSKDHLDFPSLRHWQDIFGVDSEDEARQAAKAQGWSCQFGPKGEMQIAYQRPAFEYVSDVGRNLLFASLVNHGSFYDQWSPYNQVELQKRPSHMAFGDGSPFSEQDLSTFKDIMTRFEQPVFWKKGAAVFLDNRRWTHARPAFDLKPSEKRRIIVKIGNPLERIGPHF